MQTETSITKLDINLIIPNKYQPRKVFDDNSLSSLSESIKNYGIINPILVRKKDDKYEIIAGERRYRAAKKIGLSEVPVIVKSATEQQIAELALIENIQRQGLSPIEEAKSYEEIMRIGNQTQSSLAAKLGKSQASIANKIRLLSLPEEIQNALLNKEIGERHARSLLSVEDKEKQLELLERIIKEKLTVKETEQIINEKEITENEIKQAISDIMKSLNIQEETEKNKKEEKEDDNMNNGNFFPNFDNNQVNNNASLNMMNMQSMNPTPMEATPETVMPTINQVQEPQLQVAQSPVEMQQPMPTFNQFGLNQMITPELNIANNFNPMDNMTPVQNNNMVQDNFMQPTIPTIEVPMAPETPLFAPSEVVATEQPNLMPLHDIPETPVLQAPIIDTPLFNPNANMSAPSEPVLYGNATLEPPMQPTFLTSEPPVMEPINFEVPVTNPEPMDTASLDKLTELQNLLTSAGYNYKVFSNEIENCVIIELPKK